MAGGCDVRSVLYTSPPPIHLCPARCSHPLPTCGTRCSHLALDLVSAHGLRPAVASQQRPPRPTGTPPPLVSLAVTLRLTAAAHDQPALQPAAV